VVSVYVYACSVCCCAICWTCGRAVLSHSVAISYLTHTRVDREFAEKAGLPIIFKAAMGGGGRGMRVVREMPEVEEAFSRCVSEGKQFFGDGTVFAETYLLNVSLSLVVSSCLCVACVSLRLSLSDSLNL
jgi:Carbamoyl-phosphate synthase L chain, ATP binding domain